MRRRAALAAMAASSIVPGAALAQRAGPPVIGFLSSLPASSLRAQVAAFQRGLAETGFEVGRNVAIEYRWAEGQYDRLPALAAELVRLPAAVIVASGGDIAARVAKGATTTLPIVFTGVGEPVADGLVDSINRPGGNITGVAILSRELDAKRLQLLLELVPSAATIGILLNPGNPRAATQRRSIEDAAAAVGRPAVVLQAATAEEIEQAFATLAAQRVGGVVVGADPFFVGQRVRIVTLAAHHALPAIYQWREFAEAGGLASYGPDFSDAYRQSGVLAGRILRGARPADLPVLQPTKFELVINLGTA